MRTFVKVLIVVIVTVLAVLAGLFISPGAQAGGTVLFCDGSGAAPEPRIATFRNVDPKDRHTAKTITGTVNGSKPFQGTMTVELSEGSVRMKFPPALVPYFSDGPNAWYRLKDPVFKDREITGAVDMNIFSRHSVTINRMTGQIMVTSSQGEFRGTCSPSDAPASRKF